MPYVSEACGERDFRTYLTVQGEGPSIGRRCVFLRLGGCNLSCRWCDTPYTWDWTGLGDSGVVYSPKIELHPMRVDEVLERLLSHDVDLVVISGGEPLNQQDRLVPLVRGLVEAGRTVEIETNGTRSPLPELISFGVRFNVSPKLAHAGDPRNRRVVPDALSALAEVPGTIFKYVCRSIADLDEVASIADECGAKPVWIMPEGQDVGELNRHLAELGDAVIERGWNLTTRLHVAVWGQKRGV